MVPTECRGTLIQPWPPSPGKFGTDRWSGADGSVRPGVYLADEADCDPDLIPLRCFLDSDPGNSSLFFFFFFRFWFVFCSSISQ